MDDLKALLFDLDGTLVQARNISWEIFQQTNAEFDLGIESPSDFYRLFEDNFYEALEAVVVNRGTASPEEVRNHFRELLRAEYLPELVPGIASVVRVLASKYTLMIVSSNTMESVRRILHRDNIAECFAHVFSGEIAPSKSDAISHILGDQSYSRGRQCAPYYDESALPEQHVGEQVMLITDTVGDIDEGLRAGIRVCGVAWGMHSASRLEEAGAEFVCVWPEELLVRLQASPDDAGMNCSIGLPAEPAMAVQSQTADAAKSAGSLRRRRRAGAGRAGAVLPAQVDARAGQAADCGSGSCECTTAACCGTATAGADQAVSTAEVGARAVTAGSGEPQEEEQSEASQLLYRTLVAIGKS